VSKTRKDDAVVSQPVFKLQIVTPEGEPLTFAAGGNFECALVDDIVTALTKSIPALQAAIVARGVGFTKTQAHVAADIEAALQEVLPDIARAHVRDLLYRLKAETLKLV
jgi:hypothetical protein